MAVAIMLALAVLAPAQTITTGDVTGTITDSSGAIVQNATVDLKNVNTGASRTVQSNNVGVYRFTLMAPGNYQISASSAGLKSDLGRIVVAVGQIQSVDLVLKPEVAREVVMVTDSVPLVQTENASVSSTYTTKQVDALPMPGGDITSIAYTVPGIIMSTGGGYGNFSSAGLPSISNLFTMNGADMMDPYLNLNNTGASNNTIGQNEIQEASVVQSGYEGQYGHQAGAQVNYITKSGTNDFHATLRYNYNGSVMNANDFFSNASDIPRSRALSNQWGADGSGRIKRDKLFWYADWEGLRFTLPGQAFVVIPSQDLQSYILRTVKSSQVPFYQKAFSLWNSAPGASGKVKVVNGDSGNLVDSSYTMGCGGLDGTPTGVGSGVFGTNVSCADTWGASLSAQNKEWILIGRVDANINDQQKIFFRYKMDRGLQPTQTDPINPAFSAVSKQPQYEGQITHTWVPNSRTVNNLILEAMYYSAIFSPADLATTYSTFPVNLTINDGGTNASYFSTLGPPSNFPQGRLVGQFQFADDVSHNHGSHSIKAGVMYKKNQVTDTGNSRLTVAGIYSFTDLYDFANGQVTASDYYQQRFTSFMHEHLRVSYAGAYVQDVWAVKSNLKLTLALRFEHNSNPRCPDGCFAWLNQPFKQMAKGSAIPYNQSIITGQNNAYYKTERVVTEPRFGFAWNPGGSKKSVIRGGVGIFADAMAGYMASAVWGNFPNVYAPAVRAGLVGDASVSGSSVQFAQAAGAMFNSQFASGGTLTSFQNALAPILGVAASSAFTPPGYTSLPSEMLNAKYLKWSLEVQHQFGTKNGVTVRYVGTHGYDLFLRNAWLNAYANSTNYPSGFGGLAAGTAGPDPRFRLITGYQNGGYSNYKGLSLEYRRWLGWGFQGQFGYTLAHAKDTNSTAGTGLFFSGDSFTGLTQPTVAGNYSNSDFDIRHNFTADFVWEIPAKFDNKLLDRVVGGWSVADKVWVRSGTPFSVYNSGMTSRIGTNNPAVLSSWLSATIPTHCDSSAVDTACFSASQFAARTGTNAQTGFGNMPRNSIYGPGYFSVDMSVYKKIPITEKVSFTVGASAFNVLNHPNFASPGYNLAAGGVGLISYTVQSPNSPYGTFVGSAVSGRVLVLNGRFAF
jgi:hypothetical protein